MEIDQKNIKLKDYFRELVTLFYTIGCDKALEKININDFLRPENIEFILKVIENRLLEVIFVYGQIKQKVRLSEKSPPSKPNKR